SIIAVLVLSAVFFFSPLIYAKGSADVENNEFLDSFRQVFEFIQDNYVDEVEPEVLIEGALKGMFKSLEDPYSAYLDEIDLRSLTDTTSGEFGGVGLYINKAIPTDDRPEIQEWVEVVSPIEGTPAFRAGLRPRDFIIAIEDEPTVDLSIDEVVNRLRGVPGTVVHITILRNLKNTFEINVERAIIEIPTVRYGGVQDDIAYLRIIQFTPLTAEKVDAAIQDLRSQGYRNMIIDLRTNPGGLLTAAIDTADLFFDDGLVVGTAGRIEGENQTFHAKQGTSVEDDAQLVVLINAGTASAAEILAGALKDRDKAALVGETSFGKGSVQQIRRIGDGGFRLTMAKYYTPDRIFIDDVGISPDIVVKEYELSENEEKSIFAIQGEGNVDEFLDGVDNDPTAGQIDSFITDLRAEGFTINDRALKRLITMRIETRLSTISVFDLEYDVLLQEAVNLIRENQVESIIENRDIVGHSSAIRQ
ncbi:MAG: S41 family peptidase, partial [Salinispira sp.]